MPQDEGAARVHGVERVLDSEDVRAQAGDDLGEAGVDGVQADGKLQADGGSEDAHLEEAMPAPVRLDGAVARAQGAGVDAEDDHFKSGETRAASTMGTRESPLKPPSHAAASARRRRALRSGSAH